MTRTTRRQLLAHGASLAGLGAVVGARPAHGMTHHPPRIRRAVWLFQSGGPSHLELFDTKPELVRRQGQTLPDSVRRGQRLTSMTSGLSRLLLVGSPFAFQRHGDSGATLSELLPHTARIADKLTFLKGMSTDAINHDPASTMMQTGFQLPGRPSVGAWLDHALGGSNAELPPYVVWTSATHYPDAQPIYSRLWSAGFLPAEHQGVQFRNDGAPVPFLTDQSGRSPEAVGPLYDTLAELSRLQNGPAGDFRAKNFDLAKRMQTSVAELTDLSNEPESVFQLYGEDARRPGTYARHCLMTRRLLERGVRFVQIFHRGWDHHHGLPTWIRRTVQATDQPSAALVIDLEQRGLLEDTVVLFGGEFGRTAYAQGALVDDFGRDHHPRCFSMWLAGGGLKPGVSYGQTDDFGYNVVENRVHIHDLHATLLHLFGFDHTRLTFRHQGRDFRLTDTAGRVVSEILA